MNVNQILIAMGLTAVKDPDIDPMSFGTMGTGKDVYKALKKWPKKQKKWKQLVEGNGHSLDDLIDVLLDNESIDRGYDDLGIF